MTLKLDGLAETYERTGSIYECAKIYGCSGNGIALHLERLGIKRNWRRRNRKELPNLLEKYRELKSQRKVAEFYKCSEALIQNRLDEMEVITDGERKGELRFPE